MEKILFTGTTPEQLQKEILDGVKSQLCDFLKNYQPTQPKEYLTRKDIAKMFDIDLSTVHNWCKSGKLNPLGKGTRVYFLRTEVEDSLTPLNRNI